MTTLVPSCGLTLLQGDKSEFDYVVYVTDGFGSVKIPCHRCILTVHSERLRDLMKNENFFDMVIRVKPGYIGAVIELIQYMYLKDHTLISDSVKVLEICGMFHMKADHFMIRNRMVPSVTNQYDVVDVQLHSSAKSAENDRFRMITTFHVGVAGVPKEEKKRQRKSVKTIHQTKRRSKRLLNKMIV